VISVVIPSYNHAAYLTQAIDSVIAQTERDWEIVLVDDGSIDGSVSIAEDFSTKCNLRVFRNARNLGTYGTLQRAVELAEGEFIAILNSDDYWEPTKLAQQGAAIEGASFCYTLGQQVDENGKVRPDDQHGDWPLDPIQNLLPWLLCENRVLASSVLFRRENLKFHTECRYSGDWLALIEQSLLGPAAFINEPLTSWRVHSQSTHRRSAGQVAEEVAVREAIWRRFGESDRAKLAQGMMHLAALRVLRGEMAAARLIALRAIFLRPSQSTFRRGLAAALPSVLSRRRLWHEDAAISAAPLPKIDSLG